MPLLTRPAFESLLRKSFRGNIVVRTAKAWEEETMFLLTMHPHVIGHRSRMVALEGLVEHMKERGDVWFATYADAARYVRQQAGMDTGDRR